MFDLSTLIIVCSIVSGITIYIFRRKIKNKNLNEASNLYANAVKAYEDGEILISLSLLNQSISICSTHEAYNLLYMIWSKLEDTDQALFSLRRAYDLVLSDGRNHNYLNNHKIYSQSHEVYYKYLESKEYLIKSLWEFAYQSANTAIATIERNPDSSMKDGYDHESYLRVIRLLAALQNIKSVLEDNIITNLESKIQDDAN